MAVADRHGLPVAVTIESATPHEVKLVPFEGIWACHPDPDAIVNAIVRLYSHSSAAANEFHDTIAKVLANGTLSSVTTTNYDLAVERSTHASSIRVVECEGNRAGAIGASPTGIYFKIHGSAKPQLKGSIIYRLDQEGRLHRWKRELLTTLLENRTLLAIGYSGRDFDICPEIARIFFEECTGWRCPQLRSHHMPPRYSNLLVEH